MFKRILAVASLVAASVTIAGFMVASGQSADAAAKAITPGTVVSTAYGCVNPSGAFDYWEFRSPMPHPCHYSGEVLASIPAIVLGEGASFPLDITLPGSSTADDLTCTVATLSTGLGLSCTATAG